MASTIYFLDYVERNKPLLQVALDVTRLDEALSIALSVRDNVGEGIILEAGTPLIKSVGLDSVKMLSIFGLPVLADTKTADVGDLEVRLAAQNGAAAMSVLAIAPTETIEAAVHEANRLGIAVVADMLGVPLDSITKRAEKLYKIGVHVIELHIPIDIQRRMGVSAEILGNLIASVRKVFKGIISIAGGLRRGTAGIVARQGADIIVVGSAITKSSDPGRAALEIVREIKTQT